MELTFEVNTIATLEAEVARKAFKRKRAVTVKDQEPVIQQKFNDGSSFIPNTSFQFNRKRITPPKEQGKIEQQGLNERVVTTIEPPSPLETNRAVTTDDQELNKTQKLNDGTLMSTSRPVNGSLQMLTDVALSRFTSRNSSPARSERSKGGRPRTKKQFPRQKQLLVPTKLRKDRPVTNEIPCEIWQSIFAFCPPDFLLKAVTIKYFKEILQRNEHTWKLARLRSFGPDIPDPPLGMTELQYAELLTGFGCQGCDDQKARRTYWAFERRWCEVCLVENVASVCVSKCSCEDYANSDNASGQNFGKGVRSEM